MASYPIAVTGDSGTVELTGELDFIDPDNQPAGAGAPFKSTPGDDVVVLSDADNNALIDGGDDTGGASLNSPDSDSQVRVTDNGVRVTGSVGFYGIQPVAQPTVPETTPAVQDVIDALVALGLVVQSD